MLPINYSLTWSDVGNACGFTEDQDEESLLNYLDALLLSEIDFHSRGVNGEGHLGAASPNAVCESVRRVQCTATAPRCPTLKPKESTT